jgi:hypothetical protein
MQRNHEHSLNKLKELNHVSVNASQLFLYLVETSRLAGLFTNVAASGLKIRIDHPVEIPRTAFAIV